jgi:CRISPR-associated protein Csx17
VPEARLSGCQSRPLVGYLKALGLLQVVSKQADRSARGRWTARTFELQCGLTTDELRRFLLESYAPSPVLSPWNGRGGFYRRGNTSAVKALERIRLSRIPQLARLRSVIEQTQTILDELEMTEKPADQEQKFKLVRRLRREWPDDAVEWLDAAIVLTGKRPAFPPLLGSGGNDGSYDFSSNYMQSLGDILLANTRNDSQRSLLDAALFDESTALERMTLAHLGRDSSPTNSPSGEADSLGNPWDLVLAIEGAMLLTPGAARRYGQVGDSTLVAPFTVHPTATGYGSAVTGEKGRAELWLPLWCRWASCSEVSSLVREARVQVGRGSSRRQARTGLDFARAAGELGFARGIDAFERYVILERAGEANLAVPVGRVAVSEHPGAAALGSIDGWLDRLLRFGNTDTCPAAIQSATRQLERACFKLASRGTPEDACATLEAIGAMEHVLSRSRAAIDAGIHPLWGASATPWIEAADDGTPEFAIAVALGSLRDRRQSLPGLRDYLHGTRRDEAHPSRSSFDADRRHVVSGNGVASLLAAVHARRHLDAADRGAAHGGHEQSDAPREPRRGAEASDGSLRFDSGTWCNMRIARQFVAGMLDDARVLRLLHGLCLLDHGVHPSKRQPKAADEPQPLFDTLTLAWTNGPHDGQASLGPRPGWASRLAAGAVRPVLEDVMLRLRVAGLAPILTADDMLAGSQDHFSSGQRLGAGLLMAFSPHDIDLTARRLVVASDADNNNHQKEDI